MFDTLAKGFRQARNRLAGLTELTEANIEAPLREVRLSLLEADVELGVVKAFLARLKEKAVGETVRTRVKASGQALQVNASDQFIKICHDELVALMAYEGPPLVFAEGSRPTGVMMVGLQGSGKTTSAAKLARFLAKDGHRPLLVAADMQRPAAVEQLKILGESIQIPVFNLPGETPVREHRGHDAESDAGRADEGNECGQAEGEREEVWVLGGVRPRALFGGGSGSFLVLGDLGGDFEVTGERGCEHGCLGARGLYTVATLQLGSVDGQVGLVDERVLVGAVAWEGGDPDRNGDVDRLARGRDVDRALGDGAPDPLGDL